MPFIVIKKQPHHFFFASDTERCIDVPSSGKSLSGLTCLNFTAVM